jgi:hypothetical protein
MDYHMATITFDTHEFIQTLEAAGFEKKQAEAVSAAFKKASGEAELATKHDVDLVRQEIRELELRINARFERIEGEIKLNRWMLGIIVVAEVAPLLAKLFHA